MTDLLKNNNYKKVNDEIQYLQLYLKQVSELKNKNMTNIQETIRMHIL